MVQRVILPAFRAGEFEIGLREGIDEMFTMLDTGVARRQTRRVTCRI